VALARLRLLPAGPAVSVLRQVLRAVSVLRPAVPAALAASVLRLVVLAARAVSALRLVVLAARALSALRPAARAVSVPRPAALVASALRLVVLASARPLARSARRPERWERRPDSARWSPLAELDLEARSGTR
jgi:hypothetical protein